MPAFRWTGWELNFGNVLTIAVIVFGLVAGYVTMQSDIAYMRERQAVSDARVARLETRQEAASAASAVIERDTVRILARLEAELNAIRSSLSRLERQADSAPR
jgi:hypothetical protein